MLGRRDARGELFRPDNLLGGHGGEDSIYGLLVQHRAEWFGDDSFRAFDKYGLRR